MRRGRKALLVALGLLCGALVGLRWLATPEGNRWLCDRVQGFVTGTMGEGRLEIDGLSTNLISRLELRGVRLLDGTERPVVEIPRVAATYTLSTLVRRAVLVEQVIIESPVVDIRADEAGRYDLDRMFPSEEDSGPSTGLPGTLVILQARLDDGTVQIHDPGFALRIDQLGVQASVTGRHKTWDIGNLQVDGLVTEPFLGVLRVNSALVLDDRSLTLSTLALALGEARVGASGTVSGLDADPSLALAVRVSDLAMDPLEPLTGDLGLHGRLGAELTLDGPLSALHAAGTLHAPEGQALVDATVDLEAEPLRWSAKLDPRGLDLGSFVDAVTEPTVLTGALALTGSGTDWPADVQVQGEVSLEDSRAWGYPIAGLRSQVQVAEGRVGLQQLRYTAGFGALTGDGVLTESGVRLDLRADLRNLAALADFGAPGLAGNGRADGELRVDWSRDETEVNFDGTLAGGALAYEDQLSTGSWSTTTSLRVLGDTLVSGELLAEDVESNGVTLGLVRASWLVTVAVDSAVAWEVDFAAEDLSGFEGTIAGASGYADGGLDPDGTLRTDVLLGAEGLRYDSFGAGAGVVEVHLDGDDLAMDVDLWDELEKVLALNGASDLAAGTWHFSEVRVGAESGVSWVNQEPVSLRLTEDGITEANVKLSSAAGRLDLRGRLGTQGPLSAEIGLEGFAIAWLGAMFPEDLGGWTGTADATLQLGGTGAAPTVSGVMVLRALSIPGQAWGLDGTARLSGEARQVALQVTLADQKGGLLALNAKIPMNLDFSGPSLLIREPVQADMVLYPTTFQRLATTFPTLGELPAGELSAELTVSETLIDPQLQLKVGLQTPAGQKGEWLRTDLDLSTHEGNVVLTASGWEGGQRRLNIDGTASTSLRDIMAWVLEDGPEPDLDQPATYVDNLAITAVPLGVPMESLQALVELPPDLSGRLSGALVVSGRPDHPELGGGLQLTEGKLGGVLVSPAVLGIAPEEGGYSVFGTFGFSEDPASLGEHTFEIAGFVPFSADLSADFDVDREMAREGLALTVDGTGLPIGLLAAIDPAIKNAEGLVQIQGTVAGSLAAPKPELTVHMEDGSFDYEELQVRFTDMTLDARVRATDVDLRSLRFHTAPLEGSRQDLVDQAARNVGKAVRIPEARATRQACTESLGLVEGEALVFGKAQLENLALTEMNFDVCAAKAWFSATDDLILQLTAGLEMRGAWPDLAITGNVIANEVFFSMDEADFFDTGSLELDPVLTVVRTGVQVADKTAEAEPSFYYPWDIDVKVDLNRSAIIEVTVPLLDTYDSLGLSSMTLDDTELDGELRYHQVRDRVELFGDVKTVRGAVEVMGNDFELREGSIVFTGETYTNPTLDILAVHDAGSYGEISVKLSQTAESPAVDFASDAGYTITDVLAILLMGRPTSELGQANAGGLSDIFAFASTQATGVLAQQAEVFGGGGSLVDSFQVGSSDAQVLSTITLGRSVGDRAYVEVEINRDPDEDAGDYPTEVGVEYVLNRRLEAVVRMGGENSADIYANWRF